MSSSASAPAAPPLLLTKRIAAFLQSSLPPHLHTVLLSTPSGLLLAHASKPIRPVSELRTQSTVASSLISLHSSAAVKIAPALADSSSATTATSSPSSPAVASPGSKGANSGAGNRLLPEVITVQLTDGVFVVRRLGCGLLLACAGAVPDPEGKSQKQKQNQEALAQTHESQAGSPSEAESMVSSSASASVATTATQSPGSTVAAAVKLQAEELALYLEEKLGGLRIPQDIDGAE